MELIMKIVGQIIDKETLGQQYLETHLQEVIVDSLDRTQVVVFTIEILESEPLNWLSQQDISLDLAQLNGKSIRELLTSLASL